MNTATSERITLVVEKSKKKDFLTLINMLKFVKIETNEDFIKRFVKNAPKKVSLSESDIVDELKAIRHGK